MWGKQFTEVFGRAASRGITAGLLTALLLSLAGCAQRDTRPTWLRHVPAAEVELHDGWDDAEWGCGE